MSILRKYGQQSSLDSSRSARQVLQDLHNVLNAKQGFAYFDENFGVTDISSYTDRAYVVNRVIEEVRRNISSYLPAVELLEIKESENPRNDRITIEAKCRVLGHLEEIQFITDMGAHRWQVFKDAGG